jgi:hypothetical protein
MSATVYLKSDLLDLRATHNRLEQLEHGEWFRWGATLAITLALTIGVLALSLPSVPGDLFDRQQLEVAVRGLLALVLLFDVFVIHQQYMITHLRRQLTSQLGLITALDLIKHPQTESEAESVPKTEHGRLVRCRLDQQLKVRVIGCRNRETIVQGRIREVTAQGLEAVIPSPLKPGDIVTVEFSADGCPLALRAVVRHRRGFRYGLEFTGLTERDATTLSKIRRESVRTPENSELRS